MIIIHADKSFQFLSEDIAVCPESFDRGGTALVKAIDVVNAMQLTAQHISKDRMHTIMHRGTQIFGTTYWHFMANEYTVVDKGDT